ncbi:MAG: hypothetical protein LUF92_15825 [Clostridiales bacterium]|nr:hypothetical protein [Clostridiales bacterium]
MNNTEKLFLAFSEIPDLIIWEAEAKQHRREKYISWIISIFMIIFGMIGEMTFFLKNEWIKANVIKYVVNPINSTVGTFIMAFGGVFPLLIALFGIHRLWNRLYISRLWDHLYISCLRNRLYKKRKEDGTFSDRNWLKGLVMVMTILLLCIAVGIPVRNAMAQRRLPTVEEWIREYFMFSGDENGVGNNGNTSAGDDQIDDSQDHDTQISEEAGNVTGMTVEVKKITDADITEVQTCSGTVTIAGTEWTFAFDYAFRGPDIMIEGTEGVADVVEAYGDDETKAILWARIRETRKSSFLECFLVDLQTGETEAIADQEQEKEIYDKTIYIEDTGDTLEDDEGMGKEELLSGNTEAAEERELAWKHFCYDPIFSPDKTKVIYHSNTEMMSQAEDGSEVAEDELDAGDLWYLRDLTTGETRKLSELAPELHTSEIYFIDDDTVASFVLEEVDPALDSQGVFEMQIPLAYSWSEDTWTRYDIDFENLIGNSFIVKTVNGDTAEYKDLWSGQVSTHEETGEVSCYGNRDVIALSTEENGLEFYFPRLGKWMKCDMQFQGGEEISGISSYGENVFLLTTEDEYGDSYEYEIVLTANES